MTVINNLLDEDGRICALQRYDLLDTGKEKPFENIVNLVQQTLQVPMCAVSLIDRDRQWFKASRGLNVTETARNISFCTHAIKQYEPFIVNNALEHPSFKNNPLVIGEPCIRSYLGVPLSNPEGYNLGSLCGIDIKPREFQVHEIEIMKNFAKVIMDEIELRQIASVDGLTRALTRRAWTEQAKAEIKRTRRHNRPLSLAIIDIDKFKLVNDTYGHPAGDKVIKQIAKMALERSRGSDYFGRYGGEEFVFLMTETPGQKAKTFIEQFRKMFEACAIEIGGTNKLWCTFSAGVAEWKESEDISNLMARADSALYQAKENGRNRTVLVD